MLPGAYGGLEPLPLRQRGVPLASKRQYVMPVVYVGLGICPHGIRGPLAKTGTHPTGETSSDRHNGALLAPSRGDPVENLFQRQAVSTSKCRTRLEPCRLIWPRRTEDPDEFSLGVSPV